MQLIVACVECGDYLGRGDEYVRKLRAGVDRNMRADFDFWILTDRPTRYLDLRGTFQRAVVVRQRTFTGAAGWWNKLELFRAGLFPPGARVLYLDLDVLITGGLDELAAAKGIIHLRDWGWQRDVYGSGVMVWDAGEHAEIWDRWTPAVPRRHEGDQDWITELGGWPALPPAWLRSYRYHCKAGVPADCRVVSFHGKPKPHEIRQGWAAEAWAA